MHNFALCGTTRASELGYSMKRFLIATAATIGFASAAASADPVGMLVASSGDTGTVVVLRGGKALAMEPNLELLAGDRLVVRGNGAVDVSAYGCAQTLTAPAMAMMNDQFCLRQPVTLETAAAPASAPAPESGSGIAGVNSVAAGSLGAGAIAVAAIAGTTGDDSTSPTINAPTAETPTSGGDGVSGTIVEGNGGADAPVTELDVETFDPGSGLDNGLFGFFEATSS